MLEGYMIAKLWDDPDQVVDAMLHEFLLRYFGEAAEPIEYFYRQIEEIACDAKNCSPALYKRNGIDWKNVAWTHLGTTERMKDLRALMNQALAIAHTEREKQRIGLWCEALWKWMEDGFAECAADESHHSDFKK